MPDISLTMQTQTQARERIKSLFHCENGSDARTKTKTWSKLFQCLLVHVVLLTLLPLHLHSFLLNFTRPKVMCILCCEWNTKIGIAWLTFFTFKRFKFHSLSCEDEIDWDSTNQCNVDLKSFKSDEKTWINYTSIHTPVFQKVDSAISPLKVIE